MTLSTPLRSILRGGAGVVVLQVAGAAGSYLGGVLLARGLGPHEYGRLAFALSLLSLLPQLAPLGINTVMIKLLPIYLSRGERYQAKQLIVWGTASVLFTGGVITAAGTLAAMPAALTGQPGLYFWPWVMAVLATPAVAVIALNLDICRGIGRVAAGFIPRAVIVPVLPALILFAGVDDVTGILGGVAAICALLAAGQSYYVWHKTRAADLTAAAAPTATQWLGWMRLALPMFVGTAASCVLNGAHTVVLAVFMDPVAVGAFQVAARTAAFISMPLLAANALAAPVIAGLSGQAGLDGLVSTLTHLLFWPSAFLLLGFVFGGTEILRFFDHTYATLAYSSLIVLATAQLINVGTGLVASVLSMTGHHDVCAAVYAGAAASNLVLLYAMVPPYGLLGAALATAIPIIICNVTLSIIVWRRLGLHAHVLTAPPAPFRWPRDR